LDGALRACTGELRGTARFADQASAAVSFARIKALIVANGFLERRIE
jgi:hypothetical protein